MINLSEIQTKNESMWHKICPFPVGYVYLSNSNTSPASIYGGTWSPLTGGRYIRANGTWDNGGSNTISVNQMPAHTHNLTANVIYDNAHWSSEDKGVIPQHPVGGSGTNTPFRNGVLGTKTVGGGASVLSNISKRVLLVQNSLSQRVVIDYA